MRSITTFLALLSLFTLVGCGKVASVTGGPADGHDFNWYNAHPADAKAESDYCIKNFETNIKTEEDMAKIPNYCLAADKVKDKSFYGAAKGNY